MGEPARAGRGHPRGAGSVVPDGSVTPSWRTTWGLRVFADPRFVRLAIAFILLIALTYRAYQFVVLLASPQWGYDFSAYWLAARHLIHGEAIYTPLQLAGPYPPQGQFLYLYPPFAAVLAIPLAWLSSDSYGPGAAVWAVLGAVAAAGVVVGIAWLEGLATTTGRVLLLAAAAFVFPPLMAELVLGNVHLLILGLLALAWWGIRAGGPRGEALTGVAIGAASLIKVFPALLIVWLVVTGRWRAGVWALTAAAALAVATLPVTGVDAWLTYPDVLFNIGPPADVTDALAPTVWLGAIVSPPAARFLVIGAGIVAVMWSAARLEERASFGIAVAAAVLVAPAVFQHYLAIMILPLILGLRVVVDGPPTARLALGASYLAMWPGQQPLLGGAAWVLNRAVPSLGALGVPVTLARWGRRMGPPRPQVDGG